MKTYDVANWLLALLAVLAFVVGVALVSPLHAEAKSLADPTLDAVNFYFQYDVARTGTYAKAQYPSYPNGEMPDRFVTSLYIYDTSQMQPCDPEARRRAIAEATGQLVTDWQAGLLDNEEYERGMLELAGGLVEIREFGC